MAGPRGGSGPRRPTEKGNQLANLFRIANGAWPEPEPRRWFSEESSVVGATLLEGIHLGIGVDEDAGGLVIAVSLEICNGAGSCRIGVRSLIEGNAGESGAVEILGREVRSRGTRHGQIPSRTPSGRCAEICPGPPLHPHA